MKRLKDEKELKYERLRGVPHIRNMGNAACRNTGSWRLEKPEIDLKKCVGCKNCWAFCPENAVRWKDEKPAIDYGICKGCMICANECPANAISRKRDLHRE
jgi:2-oxoacid:acceptor oxidoreductase delta subunit (pyruvate/2-ketoisovalerate family)